MAESMRERILAATVQVIKERGVTAATTKEIARTAGVSEGSLYNHFDNKTALFGSAIAEVTSSIRDAMLELLSSVGQNTVEDNLTRLATAAVLFFGELLPMTGPALGDRGLLAWLRDGGPAREAAANAVSGGPAQGHAGLIAYLEAEQRAGRIDAGAEPPFLAAALLGGCQQHAFLTLVAGPGPLVETARLPADPQPYARALVRTLLR